MSRILRRPMFRGGPVDSRGTGIASGLSYEKGGRVPRTNYSVGGIGRQMANVGRLLDDTRGGSGIIDEFGQKLTFKPTQVADRVVESTPTVKPQMTRPSMIDYQAAGQPKLAEEFIEAIRNPNTGGIDYKMAEMKIGTKLKGDETIEELVSMYLYSTRKDKLGVAALATGYGGLGAGAMMNDGQNYMANGGRVGLGNGGSYADALAQGEFEASKGNRLTFQSVIDRMNDYYNNLYTKGMFEEDLDMGMQIPRPMDTKEIVQSRIYEGTDPILGDKGKDVFQEEFFKGTFDGRNYNKELADSAKQFAKFNEGEENPYRNPDAPAPGKVVIDDTGLGTGGGTGTTDPKAELEERKKLFAELLGGDKARGEDISNMLMSFAGKALKPEATVKSSFGDFFEEESKRPSSKAKVDQAAASLAINDYIAGRRSKEQTDLFLKKLQLSQGTLTDKYNEARKVETNKVKAFATALFNKEGKDVTRVNSIPTTIDEVNTLGLSNGDIIAAPNEVNGNKVTSILQVIIDANGNVSTVKYFPDL